MGLLNKKSIKAKGVRAFAWSPTDNTLAYWVPEEGERPAKGAWRCWLCFCSSLLSLSNVDISFFYWLYFLLHTFIVLFIVFIGCCHCA